MRATGYPPGQKLLLSKGKKDKQPKPGPVVAQGLSSVYLNDTDKFKKRLKDGHNIVIKGRSSTAGKLPLLFPADEQSRSRLLTFREARERPTSDFVMIINKISPEISDADIAKELNNKSVQVKRLISARHNNMPSHNVKLTCENKATLEVHCTLLGTALPHVKMCRQLTSYLNFKYCSKLVIGRLSC